MSARVLLRAGVLVGALYLVVGLALALTSDHFDFSQYPLSILMRDEHGWIQATNLVVSGLLTVAAGWGIVRAARAVGATRWIGLLVGGYGVCVTFSGVFPPDPMPGYPNGTPAGPPSVSGMLHLLLGAVGFILLGAAALTAATSAVRRGKTVLAVVSYVAGGVIIVGFLSGTALPTPGLVVASLWLVVVVGWAWLAAAAGYLLRATAPQR